MLLYESKLFTERVYSIFVAESSVAAIQDCDATARVAGKEWFDSNCEGLTENEQKKLSAITRAVLSGSVLATGIRPRTKQRLPPKKKVPIV